MKKHFLSTIISMFTMICYCQQNNNYQIHNVKGDEYLKKGDTINAINEYTKTLLTSPKNYYALRKCGILKFSKKNFEGAEKDFTTCISIKKTDAEVFYKRGLSHQKLLGDPRSMRMKSGDFLTGGMSMDTTVNAEWRAIINDYNKTIQINPQLIDAYIQSAYIKKARSYFNYLGSPVDDYNAAIKIQPGNLTVLKLRGEYKSNNKDYLGADEDFCLVLKLNKNDTLLYSVLGKVKMNLEQYSEAMNCFNRYINLVPKDADGYYARGNCKTFLSDFSGSIEDFDTAISISPKEASYYLIRGYIKITQLKLKTEGCKDLNLAKQYKNQQAQDLIDQYCE